MSNIAKNKETDNKMNKITSTVAGIEKILNDTIDKLDDMLKNSSIKNNNFQNLVPRYEKGMLANSKAFAKQIIAKSMGRILSLSDLVKTKNKEEFIKALYKIIVTNTAAATCSPGGAGGVIFCSYEGAKFADKYADEFYDFYKDNINATIDAFSDIWDFFKNFDESIKILSEHFIKNDDKNEIAPTLNIQKTDFGFELFISKPLENDISFKIKSLNNDAKVLKES